MLMDEQQQCLMLKYMHALNLCLTRSIKCSNICMHYPFNNKYLQIAPRARSEWANEMTLTPSRYKHFATVDCTKYFSKINI